jgi:hypothetical protein
MALRSRQRLLLFFLSQSFCAVFLSGLFTTIGPMLILWQMSQMCNNSVSCLSLPESAPFKSSRPGGSVYSSAGLSDILQVTLGFSLDPELKVLKTWKAYIAPVIAIWGLLCKHSTVPILL